ncbi:MAG: glycosyltransferase family 2 protein [Candidatus Nanoarchaeia archaeon]|nr:glycosyltransferase family 2 protein [Candidatus Nanoarchaeia archaeon]
MDISFLICTYNAPELIKRCLNSILKQDYKGSKEIILVDGGSNSETLEVLKEYKSKNKNIRIIKNKKRLPEGYGKGKWLGWRNCKGKFVFIIDQDNEIRDKNCVKEMLKPFKDDVFGCLCPTYVKEKDSLTNKYIALMGTDPVFAYRSVDGIRNLKKIGEDKKDYTIITINKDNLIITGGNCFIYRKDWLDEVGGYTQDTENIARLVGSGHNKAAISKKASTHHLAIRGFLDFVKKKKKWAKTYEKNSGFSYSPLNKEEKHKWIVNLFFIFSVLPTLAISLRQFIKTREKAWLLHPILSWITGFIYFWYTFLRLKM